MDSRGEPVVSSTVAQAMDQGIRRNHYGSVFQADSKLIFVVC